MACFTLNVTPEWEEPGFKVVLRGVGSESRFIANPEAHFTLRVCGVREIDGARIDIGEGNDVIVSVIFQDSSNKLL